MTERRRTGPALPPVGSDAVRRFELLEVPVRLHLRIIGAARGCSERPPTGPSSRRTAPRHSASVRRPARRPRSRPRPAVFSISFSTVSKRRVVDELVASDAPADLRPVVEALEHREGEVPAVGGAVRADQRIARGTAAHAQRTGADRTPSSCEMRDAAPHRPHARRRGATRRPRVPRRCVPDARSAAAMPPAMVMAPIESP